MRFHQVFVYVFAGALVAALTSAFVAAQTARQLPNPARQGYAIYEFVLGDARGCVYVFGDTRGGVSSQIVRLPADVECPELTVR